MLHKRYIILMVVFLTVAVAAWAVGANSLVDQKVVLSGKVMAEGLVMPGTIVREGAILLVVDTITGSVPAARATSDGVVREVLVKPGDVVKSNDVVVRIEPAGK
jgi:biotin carboxyl carrier protein